MKFQDGSVLVEFVIYIPICLLIIISILFISVDKANIIKKQSEMIQHLNEDVNNKSLAVFTDKNKINDSVELSTINGAIKEDISVFIVSYVARARDVLSNIKLLKDILIDIGINKNLFDEIDWAWESR
ncbi:MAG: hypothetical protein ACOCRO_02880 [Halanaerobiales bacterium]